MKPVNGPIRVTVNFIRERTKNRPVVSNEKQKKGGNFKVRKDVWEVGDRVHAPTKPDVDNYGKAALDAINKAGIWWDDSQVVECTFRKFWAAVGEKPCVEVRIETL